MAKFQKGTWKKVGYGVLAAGVGAAIFGAAHFYFVGNVPSGDLLGVTYRTLFPFLLGTLGFIGAYGYTKKEGIARNVLLFGSAAAIGFGIAELTSWGTFNAASASASVARSGYLSPQTQARLGTVLSPPTEAGYPVHQPSGRYAVMGTHSPSYMLGEKISVPSSMHLPSSQFEGMGTYGPTTSAGLGQSYGSGMGNYTASLPIDNPLGRTAPDVPFDVFLLVGGQGGKHH